VAIVEVAREVVVVAGPVTEDGTAVMADGTAVMAAATFLPGSPTTAGRALGRAPEPNAREVAVPGVLLATEPSIHAEAAACAARGGVGAAAGEQTAAEAV